MTTLHVSRGDLDSAVAAYPQVKALRTATHFPHGLDITVVEHNPVAVIVADGKRVPVSGDGHLLRSVQPGDLATVQMSTVPAGDRPADARANAPVAMLAAAPPPLPAPGQNVGTRRHRASARPA